MSQTNRSRKQNGKKDVPKIEMGEVPIENLHQLFKSPKQFMWLFGVELGYHLPPRTYINWPYMI